MKTARQIREEFAANIDLYSKWETDRIERFLEGGIQPLIIKEASDGHTETVIRLNEYFSWEEIPRYIGKITNKLNQLGYAVSDLEEEDRIVISWWEGL